MLTPAIAEHQRALEGAKPEHVEAMLGGLALAFPASKVSDAEARARLGIYAAELSDIPPDILKSALRETVRTSTFFPSVAEIRKIASGPKAVRAWRLMAMQWMAAQHDRKKPIDEPITDEQRAQLPTILGKRAA